ncbi:MAG: hypothetical protein JKY19_04015 [Alcanivoracaceae bacterium]|nr:hypothetical protein [Alcanivoracaceae bacterium]
MKFEINKSSFGVFMDRGDWCSEPVVGYYQRPEDNLSGLGGLEVMIRAGVGLYH